VSNPASDDAAFQHGVALFNARDFFQAHEVWEDVWRATFTPEKGILQGMIQIAVALHHHSTGNRDGAQSVMERALRNLEEADDGFRGINMVSLRAQASRVLRELRSSGNVVLFQIERS
jgi:uncharacterized protein